MAKSAGVDPETGSMLYWIKDDQGNWVKDSNYNKANSTDRQLCGSRIPDFYGSWNNSFTYKNFDLSFLFTFSVGGKVYDSKYANLMSTRNVGQNFHKDMLNAWKAPGDITDVPRMVLLANDQISDRFPYRCILFITQKHNIRAIAYRRNGCKKSRYKQYPYFRNRRQFILGIRIEGNGSTV